MGSERSFGLVFAAVFLALALYGFFVKGASSSIYFLGISITFLVLALIVPKVLKPLNLIWFKFGLLLHKIVNPLVMGFLFYIVITPTALIMSVLGKDPLRLKRRPEAKSYWIERTPPGPAAESLKKQF